ncbi:MAG: cation:proton antiporter [Candidatus Competibacteraceae bacterium]|nr:cation:proton antiporter [Candidatus Competibacteraceae bacterium]
MFDWLKLFETPDTHTLWVLLIGTSIVLIPLLNALLQRLRIPGLVGYLLLGFGFRLLDSRWQLLTEPVRHAFEFMADLGIVALLFRVGLEGNPRALVGKLSQAWFIWLGNVVVAALCGFVAAYYLMGLSLLPSLFAATALTATSVGVSMAVWREAGMLNSEEGSLLMDVAELDDISGVALMALLFSVASVLHDGRSGIPWGEVGQAGGAFVIKFALFLSFCVLFSRYLERHLTRFSDRLETAAGQMLTVVGFGLLIAAFSSWLGFSLAIGALFAGLAFSRDPDAVRADTPFENLYAFFTPFFFVGIGLSIEPESLGQALGLGAALLLAAFVGKLVGTWLPALLVGGSAAGLLGLSLVPRAEIAMVIMEQGRQLGDWAVPGDLYGAMAVVTLGTCIGAPLLLQPMLSRRAQGGRR